MVPPTQQSDSILSFAMVLLADSMTAMFLTVDQLRPRKSPVDLESVRATLLDKARAIGPELALESPPKGSGAEVKSGSVDFLRPVIAGTALSVTPASASQNSVTLPKSPMPNHASHQSRAPQQPLYAVHEHPGVEENVHESGRLRTHMEEEAPLFGLKRSQNIRWYPIEPNLTQRAKYALRLDTRL
ncbi:hypothetical protein BJ878DRAFT_579104 [Calycina marina]|uniref:Uncharacterized protein n=1 Tax=Calycina marina TaxID=1763456 RepID=A0A9P7YVV8_9HELO|nr:hypothetical protein BJ878DRAFT_579104 [Calycina marina]